MDENRRKLLFKLGNLGLLALGAETAWASLRFARAPVSYGPSQKKNLGEISRFAGAGRTYVEAAAVFVLRDARGLAAMSATCTHLGCNVRADPSGGFICPCHGSRYDDHGQVIGGPAPRALPFVRLIRDRQGHVIADLGAPVDPHVRLAGG